MLYAVVAAATLSLAPPVGEAAPRFYKPHGAVELTASNDVIVVAVADRAALAQRLTAEPQAKLTPLYADLVRIDGLKSPGVFAYELVKRRIVRVVLAVYESSEGQVLAADGRIRARFAAGLSRAQVLARVKDVGGRDARLAHGPTGVWEVLAAPEETVEVAAALHTSHLAIWATPDFIYQKAKRFVPNDTYFGQQWHHDYIVSQGAWDIEKGSSDITIAIIDSGLDMVHPDIAEKVVAPYDALYGDNDPTPDQYDAHGTACAGLAAAVSNNELGVAGVCHGCKIMPVRILSDSGAGRYGADSDAFTWAIDHGADILSNSWGPAGAVSVDSTMNDAINYAANTGRGGKGAIVLFAAGNDDRENYSFELASHPLVLGVGATSANDDREYYSNFGEELFIAAPAGAVTLDMRAGSGYASGDYMDQFGGTSAATPVAAGVVGLVLSANHDLTRGQVVSILAETADKIGSYAYENGHNKYYGYGRINAFRAMEMVSGGTICEPQTEICDNGADEDCDFLVDRKDPSCAPSTPQNGATCEQDFQCGPGGFCNPAAYGFPNGLCSMECTGDADCGSGSTCVPYGRTSICLPACAVRSDCRQGYDCLEAGASTPICYPSCTVNGCESDKEFCNETTGECEHDGPAPPAGACTSDLECASNGRCMPNEWGFVDGFCSVGCEEDSQCAEGQTCRQLRRRPICLDRCMYAGECRTGYTCWPQSDGTGVCYLACQSDDQCREGTCNEWGLCNGAEPPRTGCRVNDHCPDGQACTPMGNGEGQCVPECQPATCPTGCNDFGLCGALVPPGEPDPNAPEVCTCDVDTTCSADCSCDPECDDKKDEGCASAEPTAMAALLGLLALLPRRRRTRE